MAKLSYSDLCEIEKIFDPAGAKLRAETETAANQRGRASVINSCDAIADRVKAAVAAILEPGTGSPNNPN